MNQITILTSPDDGLPAVFLDHQLYGSHEINMPYISLRDPDDVRLAAAICLDIHEDVLRDVPVVDTRAS